MKKPNLFLIGAPKSGTTSLASILASHPQIFIPDIKEPRFFDAHVYYDYEEDYPYKNISQYLNLYDSIESSNSTYRLDASVFNMYSEKSIKSILELSPDSKFILIIRDPLSASKSMFSQRQKHVLTHLREISNDFED